MKYPIAIIEATDIIFDTALAVMSGIRKFADYCTPYGIRREDIIDTILRKIRMEQEETIPSAKCPASLLLQMNIFQDAYRELTAGDIEFDSLFISHATLNALHEMKAVSELRQGSIAAVNWIASNTKEVYIYCGNYTIPVDMRRKIIEYTKSGVLADNVYIGNHLANPMTEIAKSLVYTHPSKIIAIVSTPGFIDAHDLIGVHVARIAPRIPYYPLASSIVPPRYIGRSLTHLIEAYGSIFLEEENSGDMISHSQGLQSNDMPF